MIAASDQGSFFEQEKLIALDDEEQIRGENETVRVMLAGAKIENYFLTNHENYNFLDCDWFKKTPIFH